MGIIMMRRCPIEWEGEAWIQYARAGRYRENERQDSKRDNGPVAWK